MPSTPEVRHTGDGSNTLFDAASGECFHSHKGALAESLHVFVVGGQLRERLQLAQQQNKPLTLLEMGLGTGLNYLLSARVATELGAKLDYHALEINLLGRETLEGLAFETIPGLESIWSEYLELMDQCQSLQPGTHQLSTSAGSLTLHLGDATQKDLPEQYFSLCYFDAFSPGSAPELWQPDQLRRFHQTLEIGGAWVTYCARGAVRRDLVTCGFEVERLIGPPGKREMLRATRR